ncbi:MAG: hypothetical protein WC384_16155 [Prolixibacteraceae bacterium]|jgi:hypothetical protein
MSSNSETGHAKNVANFAQLVIKCTSYDGSFNPSNPTIQLSALQNTLSLAKDSIASVNGAEGVLSTAIAARSLLFKPFSKQITRISNAAKVSGAPQQAVDQVTNLIRKLQGSRATPKKTDEEKQAAIDAGKQIVEISSSQTSFDSLLNNFDKLIKLLVTVPEYAPNESELTITALSAYYEDLLAKNQVVINAEAGLNNLRITRNILLYKEITGLTDVANAVKLYIKSVFGATSPQYRQVSSLKFTNPR